MTYTAIKIMNYSALQAEIKEIKALGFTSDIRLNSTKNLLVDELTRLRVEVSSKAMRSAASSAENDAFLADEVNNGADVWEAYQDEVEQYKATNPSPFVSIPEFCHLTCDVLNGQSCPIPANAGTVRRFADSTADQDEEAYSHLSYSQRSFSPSVLSSVLSPEEFTPLPAFCHLTCDRFFFSPTSTTPPTPPTFSVMAYCAIALLSAFCVFIDLGVWLVTETIKRRFIPRIAAAVTNFATNQALVRSQAFGFNPPTCQI